MERVVCIRDNRREAKHHDKYSVGVYVKRNGINVLVGHVPVEISQTSLIETRFNIDCSCLLPATEDEITRESA